ncbi:MAG: cation:proton antiporter [Candidatus Omnitrophota bacterium]|nr:cation:proton antiporter [Candidatus Omnitrophota bacterium]MBU1928930.1 cation:proton antiporter [Candidatus Omnitrophota bacterium]MBU2035345.1 cation:proton antiporter [Candidatus Omnitrophota bacterium]MBU2221682.1 cation:proton antiporter [Candidatus Omnitrophota bacterium]MBU2258204.1 cation:proton antiporter [Candidatus Omnitrophota bacterium]
MTEQVSYILSKISIPHLNILFLLGLSLFGGTIGGRILQKLRIPQVVGYMAVGILIGESGFKIVNHDVVSTLQPFSYFALGLIGFMIGGELKKDILVKYGKQFIYILLFEGVGAFIVVSMLIGIVGTFLFKDWKLAWSLGLLLGAISSATAPAATTEVLREYKTRGPVTRTVLGIVAMDDALALLLFAIAFSIAGSLSGNIHESALRTFIHPLYEIGVSITIGIVSGVILNQFLKRYSEKERILVFSIGAVLLVSGFALAISVDMLLAVMTLGAIITNFIPKKSKEIFKLLADFTPPIYVLFFVLVGAKLNISYLSLPIILLAIVYLIGRSAGKMVGAVWGAKISKAPKTIEKYLPLCLFSQAGVAIGLSILASNNFPGEIGNTIVIIITATVLILELTGPYFVKLAVTKAGEVGLNITEEDYLQKTRVKDIMDKNPPLIKENASLDEILRIFSQTTNFYYPVITEEKKLSGIISVDSIKNILAEKELVGLVLASDLKEPALATIFDNTMLSDVQKILDKHHLEYLPIVTEEKEVTGFIERRALDIIVSTKIIELQKQAEAT